MTAERRVPPPVDRSSGISPRWLQLVAVLETVTLVALVVNLATANDPGLAAGVGPVHGTLYLLAIALTFLQHASRRARALSLLPAVGAPLAAWQVRHDQARA